MPTLFKIESEKYYNEILNYLEYRFNKDYLTRLYYELKMVFPEPYSISIRNTELSLVEFISPRKIRDYRSDELAKLIALFFADKDGMRRYFASLPEHFQSLMELLCRQKYVSHIFMKAIGLDKCIQETDSKWYFERDVRINAHDIWFDRIVSHDYSSKDKYHMDTFFFLNQKLLWIVQTSFLPKDTFSLFHTELTADKNLEIYDAESEAFVAFPIISGLLRQDTLKISSFKVTTASSYKAMKQLPVKDICPDLTEYSMKFNLGQTLFPHINCALSKNAKDYPDVARKAYDSLCNHYFEENLPALLPFIKGFRANVLRQYAHMSTIILAKDKLLESEGKWIDIEALSYQTISQYATIPASALDYLHLENIVTGDGINPEDLTSKIELPLLQSFYSVLYGLGGVSLACDSMESCMYSTPFERVKYVRLNEFGKYIVGLCDTYSAPQTQETKLFELDDKHLIIRSLNPGNPYESLLYDTADSIGGGRFRMSPESFLAKCKNKKDVQEKTNFFKDYISKDLPPIWEAFFCNIEQRCNPFKSEGKQYYIMKLDAADKELASLLSTDEVLKKIIVKAEGYRVLVSKDKLPIFEQRLKMYGYLV